MEDVMCITPLGSGQEVGRSCHIIEFRNVKIMCDIGIHPGYDGMNGLPYLDRVELQTIDILLISHFHLDHVASLPYLTERTNFRGKIYMTHPTKAVTRLLLGDYIRLLQMKHQYSNNQDKNTDENDNSDSDVLYTEKELHSCLNKVECIDYHTVITVPKGNCSFYALNAGHVLGACMFYIDIGGRTILYTGDYSMEDDRHLMAAELPFSIQSSSSSSNNTNNKPTSTTKTTTDVLICESTYGVQVHASRAEREARFTTTIERIVTRGGKCLIPVFALGRAQVTYIIFYSYMHICFVYLHLYFKSHNNSFFSSVNNKIVS
jgi:cleavage and polyadenylation specificity factor subunit 3